MLRTTTFAVSSLLIALPAFAADLPSPVFADPVVSESKSWGYLRLGVAHVRQADDATLYVMDIEQPGAGFRTEPKTTLSLEAGIFVFDNLALSLSGIVPVTTPNIASGTLEGLGNLGDETVGFYAATALYHFDFNDYVTPYVGGGIGYMHVTNTEDGVVTDMEIDSAWGGVIQAGVDVSFTDTVGIFADVKRFFVSTTASGELGGMPITAEATVNPWVISTGISFKF